MAFLPGLRVGLTLDSATFVSETRRVGQAIDRMGNNVARQNTLAERSFGKLNTAIGTAKSLLAGLGIGIGVSGLVAIGRQVTATADEFTKLTGRLRVAVGETENLAAVQQRLFDVSQATRQSIFTTSELFTRLANAMRESGQSADQLLSVTETLAQAVAVSGASSQEADAALRQLSQGLAAGALRGEELNSVMEQLPRLARAIAEGLGVSIGQLRELGREGELTTELVLEAIRSQAPIIAQEFAQVPITVGDAMTQVRNSFTQLIGDTERATGSTQQLATALSTLAQTIGSPEFRAGFQEFIAEGVERFTTSLRELQRIAAGVEKFSQHFVRFKDASLKAIQDLVNGIKQWFGAPLASAFGVITAPIEATKRKLQELYDFAVGGSVIPDMVREIRGWMEELEGPAMVDPATRAAEETQAAFSDLAVEPFKNALRDIQSAFTDTFREIFSGGVTSFEDIARQAERIFVDLAANLATVGIFGGPQGGGILGALTGSGGFFTGLGGPLAAGGLGLAGGALIGSAFGGQGSLGGGIGGGLGAGLGFALGGPVGALIGGGLGAIAGGLFGGMFGGGGGGKNARTTVASGTSLGGLSGTNEGSRLVAQIDQQLMDILTARQEAIANQALRTAPTVSVAFNRGELSPNDMANLARARIGPIAQAFGLDPARIAQGTPEQQLRNLQTAIGIMREIEGFRLGPIKTQLRDLDDQFRELSDEARRLGISTAGLAKEHKRAREELEREIKLEQTAVAERVGAMTPLQAALRTLELQMQQAAAEAKQLGISTANVAKEQARLAEEIKRQHRAQVDALALSIIEPFERLKDPLRQLQTQLEFNLLNPAQQAAAAAADFRRIAAEAAAGSTIAIQQLAGAGQLFIEQAGRFGASPAQVSAVQEVQSVIRDVLGRIENAQRAAERGVEDVIRRASREQIDRLQELIDVGRETVDELKRLRR